MKYIVLFLVVTLGYLQAQTSWNCPPSANPCPAGKCRNLFMLIIKKNTSYRICFVFCFVKDTVKACANTNQFITDQVYNTLIVN